MEECEVTNFTHPNLFHFYFFSNNITVSSNKNITKKRVPKACVHRQGHASGTALLPAPGNYTILRISNKLFSFYKNHLVLFEAGSLKFSSFLSMRCVQLVLKYFETGKLQYRCKIWKTLDWLQKELVLICLLLLRNLTG